MIYKTNLFDKKLQHILVRRHFVVNEVTDCGIMKTAYYNAFLLSNFGIVVNKPALVDANVVKAVETSFNLTVPKSFYANPQDTKYFTSDELLIEQLVSYLVVECTGAGAIDLENPEKYDRIEVFKKTLPQYVTGDEIKLRKFNILTVEEGQAELRKIVTDYCAYTRPFSLDELDEFNYLYKAGYYDGQSIDCRDNVFVLLKDDITFAKFLDKKDVVKFSVQKFGESADFRTAVNKDCTDFITLAKMLQYVKDCPLSKKQAKYYNKIVKTVGATAKLETNEKSPYKAAIAKLKANDVIGAAKVFAKNGSLLERNLKMLLSRANPLEAVQILDLIQVKNPVVLYQLLNGLMIDDSAARTFTFSAKNVIKKHVENEYETKWRKSRLNDSTKKLLHDICINKINEYYKSVESLGNVYVADNFYKIVPPANTSASGKGIDVLPAGSRVTCKSDKIRTFVYWSGIYDLDASLLLFKKEDLSDAQRVYFGNYSSNMSSMLRFSGDCRSNEGAEYYDLDLAKLKAAGYKYVVQVANGFTATLNKGNIYCGYQVKDDFMTKAWDAKNIETQFTIKGDTRSCLCFAIDLETNEIVSLNIMEQSANNVVSSESVTLIKKYLVDTSFDVSVGSIAEVSGERVLLPELADVVFDDTYEPTENQKVVRSWETEKLVALVNR